MTEQEFSRLAKPDRYQVFLFSCPASFPFVFARHPWFVVNDRGTISRWEIFWGAEQGQPCWGHLHKNFHAPSQGISFFSGGKSMYWKSTLVGMIEGGEGSTARKMADFIERSPQTYPFIDRYSLHPGPNSNTYAAWVLAHFHDSKLQLAWNSFGKRFSFPLLAHADAGK